MIYRTLSLVASHRTRNDVELLLPDRSALLAINTSLSFFLFSVFNPSEFRVLKATARLPHSFLPRAVAERNQNLKEEEHEGPETTSWKTSFTLRPGQKSYRRRVVSDFTGGRGLKWNLRKRWGLSVGICKSWGKCSRTKEGREICGGCALRTVG